MQLKKGMRIRCEIGGKNVDRAYVQEHNRKIYICQNVKDGLPCLDKNGFKFSWCVNSGSEEDQRELNVTNVCILNSTNIEDIYVGAVIEKKPYHKRKVLGNSGDVWFVSSCNEGFDIFGYATTIKELKDIGYKLVPEEPPVDEEVQKAVKLLEERGIIVDGKVVKG